MELDSGNSGDVRGCFLGILYTVDCVHTLLYHTYIYIHNDAENLYYILHWRIMKCEGPKMFGSMFFIDDICKFLLMSQV